MWTGNILILTKYQGTSIYIHWVNTVVFDMKIELYEFIWEMYRFIWEMYKFIWEMCKMNWENLYSDWLIDWLIHFILTREPSGYILMREPSLYGMAWVGVYSLFTQRKRCSLFTCWVKFAYSGQTRRNTNMLAAICAGKHPAEWRSLLGGAIISKLPNMWAARHAAVYRHCVKAEVSFIRGHWCTSQHMGPA